MAESNKSFPSLRLSLWVILLLSAGGAGLSAQQLPGHDPYRWQAVAPGTAELALDSLPLVPRSLHFLHPSDSSEAGVAYQLLPGPPARILFLEPPEKALLLHYAVLPQPLPRSYAHKDSSIILPTEAEPRDDDLYRSPDDNNEFKPFKGLSSSGSISRAVSAGNNQDAVLSSNLNLQLSGNLGENTELRATITDNSIPVQAGGYTQQLREFDRVYIELENKDFGILRAGDYNLAQTDNYLLNFDKRISGAGVLTNIGAGENSIPLQAQGGLARGRFARNRFQAQEGNLGPYKLTGANGENFIIIISGSERVYLNGQLLKRGQQNDYVMDYNAGEITFTTLRPITKESRIVVEFQYTEQNYLRTILFGQTGFDSEKQKTRVSFYSEQDSKNQSLLRELTDSEKRVLSEAGDNLDEAIVSTIRPSAFSDDLVLYELRDSLGFDSVLVFSTDSTQPLYQASFSRVDENQGHYILARNEANGRVFRWVPPQNGVPQGNYSPVRQLAAPNQLQVLTLENRTALGEKGELQLDLAASKNDVNLFAETDKENDLGLAGRVQVARRQDFAGGELKTGLHLEFNQDEYRSVERIRRVEFARDWNLPLSYSEGLQTGGLTLNYSRDSLRAGYDLNFLTLPGYRGLQNSLRLQLQRKKDRGRLRASWVSARDSTDRSRFIRQISRYQYNFTPGLWAGLRSEGEWNQSQLHETDSLRARSYQFVEYETFAGLGDTNTSFAEVYFMERWDDTARFGRFAQFSKVQGYGARSGLQTDFNSRLDLRVNVRNLKVFLPEERSLMQTITSRFNYQQRFFNNSINSTTFFETGSGSEPRRSYSFVKVPPGTGTHTHTDYNNNGIKELNEFERAPTPDLAIYVQVFTPTNEFVRTSIQRFSQLVNLNAPSQWRGHDDLRQLLHRFSLLFNYQLDRKTLLSGKRNEINPFAQPKHDSLIVALNNNFRSTLFFNRSSTKAGGNYSFRTSDNHNLLNFGLEQRKVQEHRVDLRYQAWEVWLLESESLRANRQNISGNFTGRTYGIGQWSQEASLSYQPGEVLVVTGRYRWDQQLGQDDNGTRLEAQTLGTELTYNNPGKISAQLSVNYIRNDFSGQANSPIGFEMLRELRPGNNATWSLTLQRSLKKNILLSLTYNGRTSENSAPVHVGNVEVKAFF